MIELGTLRRYIAGILGPIESRLQAAISRAVVDTVDDSKKSQLVTLVAAEGENADTIERPQSYGVTFRPPSGSEAVVLAIGSAAYRVALAVQDRDNRPAESVEEGEGGLYCLGEYKVFLAADGTLALGAKEPSDFVALASLVEAELDAIRSAITGATPGSMDGGAALLASMITALSTPRGAVGSATVKAE